MGATEHAVRPGGGAPKGRPPSDRIAPPGPASPTASTVRRRVRLRSRESSEARIELVPLIDVVFLLLTFFIYAMVQMVWAQLLPVQLPTVAAGDVAEPVRAIAVTVDSDGSIFVNQQPVPIESLLARVQELRSEMPGAQVYLAADAEGESDRLPVFIDLIDRLRGSGIDELFIVGRPATENTR